MYKLIPRDKETLAFEAVTVCIMNTSVYDTLVEGNVLWLLHSHVCNNQAHITHVSLSRPECYWFPWSSVSLTPFDIAQSILPHAMLPWFAGLELSKGSVCVPGYYLYTESSGKRANATARILSQPMTIDNAGTCLHFWYHMYGSSIGTLNVYAKINGRWAFSVKLCFAVWWGGGGGGW